MYVALLKGMGGPSWKGQVLRLKLRFFFDQTPFLCKVCHLSDLNFNGLHGKKKLALFEKKMGKQIISALSFSPATFFSLFDSEK